MFESIGNFITKSLLPVIGKRISLDVDTVHRPNGTYLRIRVEIMGFTRLDTEVKIADGEGKILMIGKLPKAHEVKNDS